MKVIVYLYKHYSYIYRCAITQSEAEVSKFAAFPRTFKRSFKFSLHLCSLSHQLFQGVEVELLNGVYLKQRGTISVHDSVYHTIATTLQTLLHISVYYCTIK